MTLLHLVYRRLLRAARSFRRVGPPLSPPFRAATKLGHIVRYQFRAAAGADVHERTIGAVRALSLLLSARDHDDVERRIVLGLTDTDVWRTLCPRRPNNATATGDGDGDVGGDVRAVRESMDGALCDMWSGLFRDCGIILAIDRRAKGAVGDTGRRRKSGRHQRQYAPQHARPLSTAARDLYRSPMVDYRDVEQPPLVIERSGHAGTALWLHGLGEDVAALSTLFYSLPLSDFKVVVPSAPRIPITAENENEQRNWFDVLTYEMTSTMAEDKAGLDESARSLHRLLDAECAIIGSRNVFVGGFAHGAAMALHAALSYDKPLGGVIAISGFLPTPDIYPAAINPANNKLSVLCINGQRDHIVPIALATERYRRLAAAGVDIETRSDPTMDHRIAMPRLIEAIDWMRRRRRQRRT